jgi:WD40 repeat protein
MKNNGTILRFGFLFSLVLFTAVSLAFSGENDDSEDEGTQETQELLYGLCPNDIKYLVLDVASKNNALDMTLLKTLTLVDKKFNKLSIEALNEKSMGRYQESYHLDHALVKRAYFSKDGSRIVTSSPDGLVKILTLETKEMITLQHPHHRWFSGAFFLLDGKTIATLAEEVVEKKLVEITRFWNAETGDLISTSPTDFNLLNISLYFPQGSSIAELTSNQNGKKEFKETLCPRYTDHFSSDMSHVVWTSILGRTLVWERKTGKPITFLEMQQAPVISAVFLENTKKIVTASEDGIVRIWDFINNQNITEINESSLEPSFLNMGYCLIQ